MHAHVLNEAFESKPKAKRALDMSGTLLAYFASFEEKNHRRIMFEKFATELGGKNDIKTMKEKVFKLKAEILIEKLPALISMNGPFGIIWTPCVEGFLTLILCYVKYFLSIN